MADDDKDPKDDPKDDPKTDPKAELRKLIGEELDAWAAKHKPKRRTNPANEPEETTWGWIESLLGSKPR